MPGAAVLLLAPAAIAGLYQAHQMEVGAALELQPNGHFRYQLDYGAVSEQAEGDWTFDGKTVRLTTRPKPKAPSFELVRDDPSNGRGHVVSRAAGLRRGWLPDRCDRDRRRIGRAGAGQD